MDEPDLSCLAEATWPPLVGAPVIRRKAEVTRRVVRDELSQRWNLYLGREAPWPDALADVPVRFRPRIVQSAYKAHLQWFATQLEQCDAAHWMRHFGLRGTGLHLVQVMPWLAAVSAPVIAREKAKAAEWQSTADIFD